MKLSLGIKFVHADCNDVSSYHAILYAFFHVLRFENWTQYQVLIFFVGNELQEMARAASGYHKVLAENRALYNEVQDLKGVSGFCYQMT